MKIRFTKQEVRDIGSLGYANIDQVKSVLKKYNLDFFDVIDNVSRFNCLAGFARYKPSSQLSAYVDKLARFKSTMSNDLVSLRSKRVHLKRLSDQYQKKDYDTSRRMINKAAEIDKQIKQIESIILDKNYLMIAHKIVGEKLIESFTAKSSRNTILADTLLTGLKNNKSTSNKIKKRINTIYEKYGWDELLEQDEKESDEDFRNNFQESFYLAYRSIGEYILQVLKNSLKKVQNLIHGSKPVNKEIVFRVLIKLYESLYNTLEKKSGVIQMANYDVLLGFEGGKTFQEFVENINYYYNTVYKTEKKNKASNYEQYLTYSYIKENLLDEFFPSTEKLERVGDKKDRADEGRGDTLKFVQQFVDYDLAEFILDTFRLIDEVDSEAYSKKESEFLDIFGNIIYDSVYLQNPNKTNYAGLGDRKNSTLLSTSSMSEYFKNFAEKYDVSPEIGKLYSSGLESENKDVTQDAIIEVEIKQKEKLERTLASKRDDYLKDRNLLRWRLKSLGKFLSNNKVFWNDIDKLYQRFKSNSQEEPVKSQHAELSFLVGALQIWEQLDNDFENSTTEEHSSTKYSRHFNNSISKVSEIRELVKTLEELQNPLNNSELISNLQIKLESFQKQDRKFQDSIQEDESVRIPELDMGLFKEVKQWWMQINLWLLGTVKLVKELLTKGKKITSKEIYEFKDKLNELHFRLKEKYKIEKKIRETLESFLYGNDNSAISVGQYVRSRLRMLEVYFANVFYQVTQSPAHKQEAKTKTSFFKEFMTLLDVFSEGEEELEQKIEQPIEKSDIDSVVNLDDDKEKTFDKIPNEIRNIILKFLEPFELSLLNDIQDVNDTVYDMLYDPYSSGREIKQKVIEKIKKTLLQKLQNTPEISDYLKQVADKLAKIAVSDLSEINVENEVETLAKEFYDTLYQTIEDEPIEVPISDKAIDQEIKKTDFETIELNEQKEESSYAETLKKQEEEKLQAQSQKRESSKLQDVLQKSTSESYRDKMTNVFKKEFLKIIQEVRSTGRVATLVGPSIADKLNHVKEQIKTITKHVSSLENHKVVQNQINKIAVKYPPGSPEFEAEREVYLLRRIKTILERFDYFKKHPDLFQNSLEIAYRNRNNPKEIYKELYENAKELVKTEHETNMEEYQASGYGESLAKLRENVAILIVMKLEKLELSRLYNIAATEIYDLPAERVVNKYLNSGLLSQEEVDKFVKQARQEYATEQEEREKARKEKKKETFENDDENFLKEYIENSEKYLINKYTKKIVGSSGKKQNRMEFEKLLNFYGKNEWLPKFAKEVHNFMQPMISYYMSIIATKRVDVSDEEFEEIEKRHAEIEKANQKKEEKEQSSISTSQKQQKPHKKPTRTIKHPRLTAKQKKALASQEKMKKAQEKYYNVIKKIRGEEDVQN